MIKQIAQNHIDNFNFDDALYFISNHGEESFANKLASMARSSFTEKKVIRELERLRDELEDPESIHVDIKIDGRQKSQDSDPLSTLKQQRNSNLARMNHLQGQLEEIPSDEDRLKVAMEILHLDKERYDIWQDINRLEAGEMLPVESTLDEVAQVFEGVTNPVKIEKIRKNYVSYLSKANNGLRPKEKIPVYKAVIAEAERRLNEFV